MDSRLFGRSIISSCSVSYTHLDVYKRQVEYSSAQNTKDTEGALRIIRWAPFILGSPGVTVQFCTAAQKQNSIQKRQGLFTLPL